MTIEEIVLNMMDGSPEYNKPMTMGLAKIDVLGLRMDADSNGDELPDDLTPERYMEVWNSFLQLN